MDAEGVMTNQRVRTRESEGGHETHNDTEQEKQKLEARINNLPVTRTMYKVFALITLGMMLDGFDVYLAGGVLGQLVKTGWSSVTLNATFISTTFIGLFIGSIVTGFVGDWKGRQFAYQINLLIFGMASLASFFAPNMMTLIILRGISGIGLGAEIVTGFALLGEFVPAQSRGKWVASLSFLANCTAPITTFIAYLVIPTIGWRWMFVIVGVCSVIVWYFRRNLPESPRWNFSRGNYQKAEEVVNIFENEAEEKYGKGYRADHNYQASQYHRIMKQESFSKLFNKNMVIRFILACLILAAINTAVYTFVTWVPTLLVKKGITISHSLIFTMLMMFGAPIGAFVGRATVDKIGRKWNIVGAFILAAILGIGYAFQTSPVMIMILGFLMTICLYVLMAVGLAVYVPELFPTPVRLRSNGLAQAFGRLFTITTPYAVAWLLINQGIVSIFVIMGIFLVIVAVFTMIFGPETKKQILR
ncbi:MFS transporter [Sporolactobacillus vineae]|uniref:MFS transporter n=1 Tax=Sporolactobacillus vineae TaxID=444463 RepID=UPI00028839B9|nr:MFS transporter [Sporolactobacillus vineae]